MKFPLHVFASTRSVWIEYRDALGSFSRNARLFLWADVFFGIGTNMFGLLYNLYLKHVGISEDAIGLTLSVHALGSVLIALPASAIAARFEVKRFLVLSVIFSALAYSLGTLTADLPPILAGTALTGAFGAVLQVCSGPFLMRNSEPKERTHLFALNGALGMGTGFIGAALAGFLKDGAALLVGNETWAYRISLLAGVAFVAAGAIPITRISPEARNPDNEIPGISNSELSGDTVITGIVPGPEGTQVKTSVYLRILVPGFLVGMGAGLTIPYINLYFKHDFRLDDAIIGTIYSVGQIFTFLGIAMGPAFARKFGKPRVIVWTQALSIPFILLLTWTKFLPVVILGYLARQALMNMSSPLSDNFALEQIPKSRQHLMNALRMFSWTLSWMVAARVSGSLIAGNGYAISFTLTALLYALSTLLYWLFFVRRTQAGQAGEEPRP